MLSELSHWLLTEHPIHSLYPQHICGSMPYFIASEFAEFLNDSIFDLIQF